MDGELFIKAEDYTAHAPIPSANAESLDDVAGINRQHDIDILAKSLTENDKHRDRVRKIFGGSILFAGLAYVGVLASGHAQSVESTITVPFEQAAQNTINDIPSELSLVGEVALVTACLGIGSIKIASGKNKRLKTMDEWSSHDMSEDGIKKPKTIAGGLVRSGMRNSVAGRIPIVLAGGVLLSTLSASIGTAVSEGPQNAIQAFTKDLPGESFLQEYSSGFTMTDNNISDTLAVAAIDKAHSEGIKAVPFDFNLGQIDYKGHNLSDLALGIPVNPDSALAWSNSNIRGCQNIPIEVDSSAHIKDKSVIQEDGVHATVVGQLHGTSATNRIGVEMALSAMQKCLDKNAEAPISGVVLDAPMAKATSILSSVNKASETATVVSKQAYEHNSQAFWDANVLPLISILEIASFALVGLYAQRASREQLVKLRREWAAKLASGDGDNIVRGTEMLRAVKDGVAASVVGNGVALATPAVVNTLVSGIGYTVGFKGLMVGTAIGIVGSGLGAGANLVRLNIDVAENTRV